MFHKLYKRRCFLQTAALFSTGLMVPIASNRLASAQAPPIKIGSGICGFIQSTFGNPRNFEVVVLEGKNLVHYFHDNSKDLVSSPWVRLQTITTAATGPGCIIQSTFGNFEVIVPEGKNLVHYFHDNSNPALPWGRVQVITTKATGPGCIIQSTFGNPRNFEVVLPEGKNLVHYFHDNSNPGFPWGRVQVVN